MNNKREDKRRDTSTYEDTSCEEEGKDLRSVLSGEYFADGEMSTASSGRASEEDKRKQEDEEREGRR